MQNNLCDIIEIRLMNDIVKLPDVCNIHILFYTLLNISMIWWLLMNDAVNHILVVCNLHILFYTLFVWYDDFLKN